MKIDIDEEQFKVDIESGNYTPVELAKKYNLMRDGSPRRVYYVAKKIGATINTRKDLSYITAEYRERCSKSATGKKRTPEQIENYRVSARKRGNNRPVGTYKHTEETRKKIRESNIETYKTLPYKWVDACISNEKWFNKLRRIDRAKLTEWERYNYEVRLLTWRNARRYKIEGTKDNSMHLDHILSISEGFKVGASIEEVAHPANLRYIPAKDNLKKSWKSDISILQLREKIISYVKSK